MIPTLFRRPTNTHPPVAGVGTPALLGLMLVVFLLQVRPTRGDDFGVAASGNWFDAETWVSTSGTQGIPEAGDGVFIGVAGFPEAGAIANATVTLSGSGSATRVNVGSYLTTTGSGALVLSSGSLATSSLTLDGTSGGAATLDFAGGSLGVAGELAILGPGVTLTRTAGSFTTANLALNAFALATTPNDTISSSVSLMNGSSLTLGSGLSLSGNLTLSNATLNLQDLGVSVTGILSLAEGSAVNRGAGAAGSISAGGFTISGSTSFTVESGDAISGPVSISDGADLAANAPLSGLSALSVTGTGSTFVANGQVAGLGSAVATVAGGALLTANGGLTAGTLTVAGGTLELNGGLLEASTLALGSGDTAATVLRGGGSMDIGAGLIDGNTAVPLLPADAFDSLRVISGNATVAQGPGDLTGLVIRNTSANALTVEAVGGLTLNFDAPGSAVPSDWVLRWNGDQVAALVSLIDNGYVTVNRLDHRVTYDAALNATFVMVPEPSSALLLLALGPAGWWLLTGRRRSAVTLRAPSCGGERLAQEFHARHREDNRHQEPDPADGELEGA